MKRKPNPTGGKKPQANPTESTKERQEYLDRHRLTDNKGAGCREVVLGAIVALMLALILACGASTYSHSVDTKPTVEMKETVRAAKNEARGIVPVGTIIP